RGREESARPTDTEENNSGSTPTHASFSESKAFAETHSSPTSAQNVLHSSQTQTEVKRSKSAAFECRPLSAPFDSNEPKPSRTILTD
ncbi:hypothetical protein KUCAC02_021908, partial [Chaenocephalus aceratus]